MSLRNDWSFDYSSEDLMKAVREKIEHHQTRLEWWEKDREGVKQAIRELGIDLREFPVTGGNRAELVVDPVQLNRLQEILSKIRGHERSLKEYRRYERALAQKQSQVSFALDIEDVQFFGL